MKRISNEENPDERSAFVETNVIPQTAMVNMARKYATGFYFSPATASAMFSAWLLILR